MKVSLQITKKIQNTNNTETENKCGGNNLDRLAFKVRINRIIQTESLAGTNALRHWKSVVYSRNRESTLIPGVLDLDIWLCLTSLFVCLIVPQINYVHNRTLFLQPKMCPSHSVFHFCQFNYYPSSFSNQKS